MIRKRLSRSVVAFALINFFLFMAVLFYKMAVFSFEKDSLVKTVTSPAQRSLVSNSLPKESNSCTPKKNVVFLKTHKTGGSTLSNVINRFGDKNKLVFVVPTQKYNRLGWPWFFNEEYMIKYNGTKPNMLCSHARYNRDVLERVMPNDTVYVTILRDPVEHFESTFSYMAFGDILGISNQTDPLEVFLENPKEVLVQYLLTQDLRINSDRLKLIRNGMFFDLGLESKDFDNTENIEGAIRRIDQEFDLVLITEYFEESMIMLKNLLCWETEDMVHFHLNQRLESQKSNISSELVSKIKKWNNADTALYEHFKNVFLKKLSAQGLEFVRDMNDLKSSNAALRDICLESVSEKDEGYHDVAIKGFKIRENLTEPLKTTCDKMTWSESLPARRLWRRERKKFTKGGEEENSRAMTLIDSTWKAILC